jgi:hypothetical protein
MISTKLTTINQDIKSCQFIPEPVRALVQRRTADNKHFGKLEICAPLFNQYGDDEKEEPQRIIAGFLLDTSGSMDGIKLQYAVNTIRKFVEVIHEERNGKTIDTQPFHAWMYLITFNSKAELVIPFQEITEITIPKINECLDKIRTDGSTNYEAAFEKQTQVLEEIIQTITEPTTILRFFETDGEITQGTMNIKKLYDMMRSTTTTTATAAETATAPRITFEDYVLGYGTDVDLVCLKALASRTPPPATSSSASTATAAPAAVAASRPFAADSLSTLVTILKPEEIGWRVGEILSKFIMRYGSTFKVSIGTTTAAANAEAMNQGTIELFEYETHQWGHSTTIQTMMHGETRTLWVQYTPPPSSSSQPISAPAVAVRINIQYENRRTGEEFTATFEHSINPSMTATVAATADTLLFQKVISIVLGMIQIEILKQYREIEADRYDMDTIVREAYKTKRMLNSIDGFSRLSFPNIACQTANLMTDVKVIIGLTTIQNFKEQKLVLHARRICSAEQELFNTGAAVSRKYVDFEENYEEEATRVIELRKQQEQKDRDDNGDNDDDDNDDNNGGDDDYDDAMPSRIPTRPPVFDTPCPATAGGRRHNQMGGSTLRTLCVKIATARNNNEDISAEEIYDQYMRMTRGYYDADCDAPRCHYDPNDDDTFSSTPMNDEYTQRRKGMMRQMSS